MSKDTNPDKTESYKTMAQLIFEGKEMVVERKENMTFEEYQYLRKIQSQLMKRLFRGSPSRKLSGIMGTSYNSGRISKGVRRVVKQRKSS